MNVLHHLYQKLKKHSSFIGTAIILLFSTGIFVLTIKGIPGNPTPAMLNTLIWRDNGPLELSPDRGRFALLYSLIEDHSFSYSLPIARFVVPDLGYKNGKYVSLFAPGVSFAIMPGYLIGRMFQLSQIGTFASISVFALLNFLLIRSIAIKIGASRISAAIAGLFYLFGTPAFAYAVSLYQHHISTFLLLLSIYILVAKKSKWWYSIIWLSCATALSVDYPNAFFFFPVGLVTLFKMLNITKSKLQTIISFDVKYVLTFFIVTLPISFFLWTNYMSYGNPLQLAGTIGGVRAIDAQGKPTAPDNTKAEDIAVFENPDLQQKTAVGFFLTRNLPNGMYTHTVSPDRGTLYYAPIMFLGIVGLFILVRQKSEYAQLLVATSSVIFLLYSLWGDPYGGWAFGSRYMIPAYAIVSLGLATFLDTFRKNVFILLFVFLVGTYSISVNTIGALTSNRNPPKVEILALEEISGKVQRYTVRRNMEMLDQNTSKSFIFQTVAYQYVSAWNYTILIAGSISFIIFILSTKLYLSKEGENS